MKILLLLSLILLVTLVAGCIQQLEKLTDNITSNETEASQQPELNLTIYVPKISVTTDEPFTGQYIAENKGKVFKAYIVTSCIREGYEKSCTSKAVKDSFPDEQHEWNRDFKQILKPCDGSCVQESFGHPGTYSYKLEVYDCSQIENILGVNCNIDIDYDNVKSKVPLLESVTKTVTVTQSTCTPQTCQQLGYNCGSWSDGCSGTINCGSCSAGLNCNTNGQCSSQACIPSCVGKNCGSDGCGGSCGTCTAPQTCNNGVCSCILTTCQQLGYNCGSWNDNCGGTLLCGSCNSSYTCQSGVCVLKQGGIRTFLNISKTSFSIGENFGGLWKVINDGIPTNLYIIATCRRNDYSEVCRGGAVGEVFDYIGASLQTCNINETYYSCGNSFQFNGSYNFYLGVYNCSQIENILGVSCRDANYTDVMAQILPINSTETTVTVS
ncbi:hypothetical protein A3K64_02960 [Candidatus Micrarchaeota archaeon RBG_16_36_9]|nr:MAG: hypothetical protein A3K64_02960 [Candidatus Micrarchaeota archaeon RBG_16_36_9]